MFVLDSSALIELIEGLPRTDKVLRIVGDAPLVTTSISIHEVLAGATSPKDRFIYAGILPKAQVLQHDAVAAKLGAEIEQELSRTGNKINKLDVLIAAVCKAHHAELITLDKDFAKIKGLKSRIIS